MPVKKTTKKITKKPVKKPAKKSVKKPVKKAGKKPAIKKQAKQEKPIGKITHYFSKLSVAVIKLSKPLAKGDTIRVIGGENDFEQKIKSMEIDGKKIEKAKAKDDFGLKVDKKVREGYKVYKV
jgi:hypothetical protein